jgi:3-dehydroquinate synthase
MEKREITTSQEGESMTIFHVPLKKVVNDSYDVEIGRNLMGKLIRDVNAGLVQGSAKYAIITDSICEPLFGHQLLEGLRTYGYDVHLFSFEAGEKHKTRETKNVLEDQLLDKAFGRDSCIIALGGGVVSDLAGFLAGTYCRGIPYLIYSTTFLAAADASIGGKTGVDTDKATNMIGLFYQPKKVYIDLSMWATLPIRQIRCGLSETIKHACIADYEFFEYLETHVDKVLSPPDLVVLDGMVCEQIALKNCEIKHQVVKEDEKEHGLRQILNLGHTIGRALEPLCNYELLHGEAVAIGIAVQAQIGKELGFMNHQEVSRVIGLLGRCGLPTEIPQDIDNPVLIEKMHTDKKARDNKIRFVFQEGIGKIKRHDNQEYSLPVNDEFLLELLHKVRCKP